MDLFSVFPASVISVPAVREITGPVVIKQNKTNDNRILNISIINEQKNRTAKRL